MMDVLKVTNDSVLIGANDLKVWVDVWTDNGETMADWNKYIFHLPEDQEIKDFQEDTGNFTEATSLAIQAIEG